MRIVLTVPGTILSFRMMKFLCLMLGAMLFPSAGAFTQNSSVATGGNASGDGGVVSYSVGLVAFESFESDAGRVQQGLQQVYEISVIDRVEYDLLVEFMVYPNPTSANIILKVSDPAFSAIDYQMVDMRGRPILEGSVLNDITYLSTSDLSAGIYLLYLYSGGAKLQTFKIVKR